MFVHVRVCAVSVPATHPAGRLRQREDPRDALVVAPRHREAGRLSLEALPSGAVLGTSSLRRQALIRRARPDLECIVVRGNLNTRLRKLEEPRDGEPVMDALVLAVAGLRRLGWWEDKSASALTGEAFAWGVGQGALGIECRAADVELARMIREAVEHPATAIACVAERAMLRGLLGGCQVPIAACSRVQEDNTTLELYGVVASLDGTDVVDGRECVHLPGDEHADSLAMEQAAAGYLWVASEARLAGAVAAGLRLARHLIDAGADRILGPDDAPPRPPTYGSVE